MTVRSWTLTALALVGLLSYAEPVSAQALLLRLHDTETGEPLQGAVATVLDGSGEPARSALSDGAGRVRILDLAPGRYGVRVEMIGYATGSRDDVVVEAGVPTVLEFRLSSRAIEIEGLSVEGEERCRVRPEEGLRVAVVWDEVRKALEATRLTEDRAVYRYRAREYVRDVEERSGRISNQQSRTTTLYSATPYRSRPAADLMENGFVQAADDEQGGDLYFGPDATVLLSDLFLDSHCIRLRSGDDENQGLVGLAFEPVSGRRLPDIAGTLWTDPESWVLERLEYRYVNLDHQTAVHDVGGDVRFQRLPDGTWIIPAWEIRMPWMAVQPDGRGGRRIYQHGVREEGATVVSVRERGGPVILTAETATVQGVVLEDISSEPVENAEVALVGTDRLVLTDSDGRFRFAEVVPGRYELTVHHPTSAVYGTLPEPAAVEAVEGVVESMTLRLPSRLSMVERACREERDTVPGEIGILVGRALDGSSGVPLADAAVTVGWDDWRLTGGSGSYFVGRRSEGIETTTGTDGEYRLCAVPMNTRLLVSARWGPFQNEPDSVRVTDRVGVVSHDIRVDVGAQTLVAGRVTGYEGGEVVAGAEVRLTPLGRPGEEDAEAGRTRVLTTDAEGAFRLPDAQVGRWTLTVSSLGYREVTDTVDARGGRLNQVTVRLPDEALEIEGVTVAVEARLQRLDRAGFYERRRMGGGVFVDADEIAEVPVTTPQELFRNRPGVQIRTTTGQTGSRLVLTNGSCMPAVYMDGSLVRRAMPFDRSPDRAVDYLDDLVSLGTVEGIEFFRDPAEIPAQYGGTGADCGVVLVWTR